MLPVAKPLPNSVLPHIDTLLTKKNAGAEVISFLLYAVIVHLNSILHLE